MIRVLLIVVLILLPSTVFGNVVITEVMCQPSEGVNYEWVKIQNIGTSQVDISGWKFNDGGNHNVSNKKEGTDGDFILAVGEEALLVSHSEVIFPTDFSGDVYDTVMTLTDSGKTLWFGDDSQFVVYGASTGKDILCPIQNTSNTDITTQDNFITTQVQDITTIINEVTKYRTVEIQPPQDIYIREISDITALVGSTVGIHIEVYDSRGSIVKATCGVSFGDGESGDECDLLHIYEFSGNYILTIGASKHGLQDAIKVAVKVVRPSLQVRVDSDNTYVEIINNADTDAELSGWLVKVGRKRFTIPSNTVITAEDSTKISTKTLDIDMAKYGGVVLLIDALGTVIADSSQYREIEEDERAILVAGVTIEESEEQVTPAAIASSAQNGLQLVPIVSGQRDSLTTSSLYSQSQSIIGIHIDDIEMTVSQDVDKEIEESVVPSKSKNIQHFAAVSTNVPGESWKIFDVLPQESGKWFVGLLALLGIAAVPVLMSKGSGVLSEDNEQAKEAKSSHTDATIASFTIEEVK